MFESLQWSSIVWQPAISPLKILGAVIVLTLLAILVWTRLVRQRPILGTALLLFRLISIGALGLILMGPSTLQQTVDDLSRPRLSILLDTSASMLTTDCGNESRLDFAVNQFTGIPELRRLDQDFYVRYYRFDEQLTPWDAVSFRSRELRPPAGDATTLVDSVHSVLNNVPAQTTSEALILISDGHDTSERSIQSVASESRHHEIPIYTLGVGGVGQVQDVTLTALPMQEFLLPDEPGSILVKVYQSGYESSSTTLKVLSADKTTSFPVDFHGQPSVDIQVPIQESKEGAYEYQLSIDALPGEKELRNNSQSVFCNVHRQRIRVLILEGNPFWDSKFLAQSLRKDERIELTQITQLSTSKKETIVTRSSGRAPQTPRTADDWAEYDIVILGTEIQRQLSSEAALGLVDFVREHGGHVILSRGPPINTTTTEAVALLSSLQPLFPVTWSNSTLNQTTLEMTDAGRSSPWLAPDKMGIVFQDALLRLPGFESQARITEVKPATVVLATANASNVTQSLPQPMPAIVQMQVGRGTCVGILGDGLWRWSLLKPADQDLAGLYDTFWSNLVRWLAMGGDFPPGNKVALQIDRSSLKLGQTLTADIIFKGTGTPNQMIVTATGSHGESQQLIPTRLPGQHPRFRTQFVPSQIGSYRIELQTGRETLEQRFSVFHFSPETLHISANHLNLQLLSEQSGGKYFTPETLHQLPELLHRRRTETTLPPQSVYLWDHFVVLSALLVWMSIEWLIRRQFGLL